MDDFSSLFEILKAIEARLNSLLSDSKNNLKFNKSIKNLNELEILLKLLNDFIIKEKSKRDFNDDEKALMRKVLDSIIKLEKINNNKLGFFDSLNKHFSDNVNK